MKSNKTDQSIEKSKKSGGNDHEEDQERRADIPERAETWARNIRAGQGIYNYSQMQKGLLPERRETRGSQGICSLLKENLALEGADHWKINKSGGAKWKIIMWM